MKSKKGFYFSVFVILSLALIIFTFKIMLEFKEQQKAEVFEKRADAVQNFVEDFEIDLEKAVKIIGYRSLLGAFDYIKIQYDEKDDPKLLDESRWLEQINESFMDGVIDGVPDTGKLESMQDSTFNDWKMKINNVANDKNIEVKISNEDLASVRHTDPFVVEFTLVADVNISDVLGSVSYVFHVEKSAQIDINDGLMPDPLYYYWSKQNYKCDDNRNLFNTIRKMPGSALEVYPTPTPQPSDAWLFKGVDDAVEQQLYFPDSRAPSYLQRFRGEFPDPANDNPMGIASFVNVKDEALIWKFTWNDVKTCTLDYQLLHEHGCQGSQSDPEDWKDIKYRFTGIPKSYFDIKTYNELIEYYKDTHSGGPPSVPWANTDFLILELSPEQKDPDSEPVPISC